MRTTDSRLVGAIRAIVRGAVIAGLSVGLIESSVEAQVKPSYEIQDFGVIPRPVMPTALLNMESVRTELKITDAQKKEQHAITNRRMLQIQQARREIKDLRKFQAAREVIFREAEAALRANLTPSQRERLDQIQIQAEGMLAFTDREFSPIAATRRSLSERLKLSDEQARKCRAIADAGEEDVLKAARFPIALESKNGPPTVEAIRKLVDSPQFLAAKEKARNAGRDASAVVIRRIEAILTAEQRDAYHKLLGPPFDVSTLGWGPSDQRTVDIQIVGSALGLNGGQRADPDFDTKVPRPAYANGAKPPRVLFDEAHHNFHTASGRYKPFAELIGNDGYSVVPNREKFSRDVLEKGEILIIANALGAEDMSQPAASDAAFTDVECDAVRDWVKNGGSLLFITDHAPMGAAAECLAKRFDVSMSKSATSDPANSEGGDTSLVFTRKNGLLGDHPITRGRDESERVNRIQTFTGTSLKGPEGSVPILKLADTAVDLSFNDDKPVSAAGRAQGVALALGKGRVVVLGEAAELSAQVVGVEGEKFGMNIPGLDNRQMALNIMHWLSGLLEPREGAVKKAG